MSEWQPPSLDAICLLVAVQLGVPRVAPGDRLVEDLGAESADVLNLVATLEERSGITIAEEEIGDLATVHDLWERVRRPGR